jgi:hypothetical protein
LGFNGVYEILGLLWIKFAKAVKGMKLLLDKSTNPAASG